MVLKKRFLKREKLLKEDLKELTGGRMTNRINNCCDRYSGHRVWWGGPVRKTPHPTSWCSVVAVSPLCVQPWPVTVLMSSTVVGMGRPGETPGWICTVLVTLMQPVQLSWAHVCGRCGKNDPRGQVLELHWVNLLFKKKKKKLYKEVGWGRGWTE